MFPELSVGASRVALGLWPIAGMTTIGVDEDRGRRTIAAALEAGINCFDTAYSYGADGRSDRLLGEVVGRNRESLVIIGKAGSHYDPQGQRRIDGSPPRLKLEVRESLQRSGLEYFDLMLLHQPDPLVPIELSAAALAELRAEGLVRAVGLCNADVSQLDAFASVTRPAALQIPFNLIQRNHTSDVRRWCHDHNVRTTVYWVLLKGLLAGRMSLEHQFPSGDSRPRYAMYQTVAREKTEVLLDGLRRIADRLGVSVAQLVVAATLAQPSVDIVLLGAHRPEQIIETAAAGRLVLDGPTLKEIEALLVLRGDEPIG
jgi:aryl-alcohol dehydrogenase-like predicted oxidoreductase